MGIHPRLLAAAACLLSLGVSPAFGQYKAGIARAVITPEVGLWMAGYAARTKPAEGTLHELYARALAIEDEKGTRLVFVATDLLGLPRSLSADVAREVEKLTGLPRANLMLTSSHTHCGPVLREAMMDMYEMPEEQKPRIQAYTGRMRGQLVELVQRALADMRPAQLAHGQGTARFAVNRRLVAKEGVKGGSNPAGPVDHDVPVLRVQGADGQLLAVVLGYACHNTTLQFHQWAGDYAGFAQLELEKPHPGALALFWSGCGGDANPLPRGTVELCEKYGKELAAAVQGVLVGGGLAPIQGPFRAAYVEIDLPYGPLPSRAQLAADQLSKTRATRIRAEKLMKTLEATGKIDDRYPHYPIQVWRLGGRVLWLALGGEVTVDYSHRFKRELGRDRPVWVTAYANDVMAYVPSLRVLREGGYEGGGAMVYYGLPAPWAEDVEERIVRKVIELARRLDETGP